MQLQNFIADSAMEAVSQIRESLGPDAVVVNVRQLRGGGLARLWSKPRVEMLAYRPEESGSSESDSITELRQELAALKDQLENRTSQSPPTNQPGNLVYNPGLPRQREAKAAGPDQTNLVSSASEVDLNPTNTSGRGLSAEAERGAGSENRWRIGALLESTGLLPLYAQQVVETLRSRHGHNPPESVGQELQLATMVLQESWRSPLPSRTNIHVFVGAPGVGKTACLCQWLTRAALVEGHPSRIWRLDGRSANHAETLSVYAEILGVPVERHQPETTPSPSEIIFVDLPGINWIDPFAIQQLTAQLAQLPESQVHLVLNAAYETTSLLAQARAFGALPMTDLIFTHLDEEPRWGKLWNFIFGTKYTIGCLNAGQNVPGDFQPASAEKILARQFSRK